MTAFGIFAFVAIAGAFFFNISPNMAEASATEAVATCSSGGGSCGCEKSGECGKTGCNTGKTGCGCGAK